MAGWAASEFWPIRLGKIENHFSFSNLQRGFYRSHSFAKLYQNHLNPIPCHNHNHPHTLYSREDPRSLVTVSSAIMIVVHLQRLVPCTHA
jgi:hypothetical protein